MSSAEPSFPTGNLPDRLTHLAQLDDRCCAGITFVTGTSEKVLGMVFLRNSTTTTETHDQSWFRLWEVSWWCQAFGGRGVAEGHDVDGPGVPA
jgi:hypothetical protein